MTVVIDNASSTFVRALKEMAKLDGASVSVDDFGYYSKSTVNSILRNDSQMENERRNGTLKVYDTVDEMFSDL